MIGLLLKLGLSKRFAQIVAFVVVPLLILLSFYLVLDAYGDSRYKAGVGDTDAKWQKASERTKELATASAGKADVKAEQRLDTFTAKVAQEKEKLDAAEQNGSSPLDVLFGG